jgi:Xaa-Pro aminopeptidase
MDEYVTRRNKLAAQMRNGSIAILSGAAIKIRNHDADHPFRQDSNFYYFTGFSEPNAVFALSKDAKGNILFVLFNQSSDPSAEVWTGKRVGQDDACKIYKADESYDITNIDKIMPDLFSGKQTIYYPLGSDDSLDLKVLDWLKKSRNKTSSFVPDTLTDILPFIHELRLFKSDQELEFMRKAAIISAHAHLELMQTCKPGMHEYQLEAIFNAKCLDAGCRALAYNSIVASGNNACTLHYTANDQKLMAGDLVLVDAGGEYNNYASDITRTFPVNGKFTEPQRLIYQLVLDAQLAGIAEVKPGNTWDRVQIVILEILVKGLVKLGILIGDYKQLIKDGEYKKFYMHSSGHWLGLDVHDAGKYKINGQWRKFEPGMVLTVEPGIYISNNAIGIDSKWLGIGVRIEDDVLVTKKGHEVLSSAAPKSIEEIERAAF